MKAEKTRFPSWAQVRAHLEQLPRGWKGQLAVRLDMTPSGISKMLGADNDPRYDQVVECLRLLEKHRNS